MKTLFPTRCFVFSGSVQFVSPEAYFSKQPWVHLPNAYSGLHSRSSEGRAQEFTFFGRIQGNTRCALDDSVSITILITTGCVKLSFFFPQPLLMATMATSQILVSEKLGMRPGRFFVAFGLWWNSVKWQSRCTMFKESYASRSRVAMVRYYVSFINFSIFTSWITYEVKMFHNCFLLGN